MITMIRVITSKEKADPFRDQPSDTTFHVIRQATNDQQEFSAIVGSQGAILQISQQRFFLGFEPVFLLLLAPLREECHFRI